MSMGGGGLLGGRGEGREGEVRRNEAEWVRKMR